MDDWTEDDALGIASGCAPSGSPAARATLSKDNGTSHRILPHSGQEMLTEVDLFIPGRDPAVDLVIQRRHLSRVNQPRSAFGPAWSFNYQQIVQPVVSGSAPCASTAACATWSAERRPRLDPKCSGFGNREPVAWNSRVRRVTPPPKRSACQFSTRCWRPLQLGRRYMLTSDRSCGG